MSFWKTINTISRDRPPPAFPESFTADVETDDAEEMVGDDRPDLTDLAGMTMAIRYRDSKGQETSRRITLYSARPRSSSDFSIYAKCHERQAFRHFHYSRILEITDWGTGEVFAEPDEYFQEIFECSLGDMISKSLNPLDYCRHGIAFLSYLTHADGRVLEEEIESVLLYCDDIFSEMGVQLSRSELRRVRNYVIRFEPTEELLDKAIKHFRRKKKERALLEKYANKLAASDGVIDDKEFELLMEIAS